MCDDNDQFAAVWGRPAQGSASGNPHSLRAHGGNPLSRRGEQHAIVQIAAPLAQKSRPGALLNPHVRESADKSHWRTEASKQPRSKLRGIDV